ncbi:hypothetical protein [Bacillus sp. 2205SS5-2]|uniref:hypothetical protein n=1 Tax=Bacillus sp. 2205SS5-2 TaxID=3109031 RepID=UPI0030056E01
MGISNEGDLEMIPSIHRSSVIGPKSVLMGKVNVKRLAYIGCGTLIKGNDSYPIYIGERANIHDHSLLQCQPLRFVEIGIQKYSLYVDDDVTILENTMAHGPLSIGKNSLIGQNVLIYQAEIGSSCVVMHGAIIANNVKIPCGRFVGHREHVYSQAQADGLPVVPEKYQFLNEKIVDFYMRIRKNYKENIELSLLNTKVL